MVLLLLTIIDHILFDGLDDGKTNTTTRTECSYHSILFVPLFCQQQQQQHFAAFGTVFFWHRSSHLKTHKTQTRGTPPTARSSSEEEGKGII